MYLMLSLKRRVQLAHCQTIIVDIEGSLIDSSQEPKWWQGSCSMPFGFQWDLMRQKKSLNVQSIYNFDIQMQAAIAIPSMKL